MPSGIHYAAHPSPGRFGSALDPRCASCGQDISPNDEEIAERGILWVGQKAYHPSCFESFRGWLPIEALPETYKNGVSEIVALSPAYVRKDGKPAPIILRWFTYNGTAAWRDWDNDPHFPTHWHPLAALPAL